MSVRRRTAVRRNDSAMCTALSRNAETADEMAFSKPQSRSGGGHLLLHRTADKDERNLVVTITPEGEALKEKAACIPTKIGSCVCLSNDESKSLYNLLYKIISNIR